MASKQNTDEVSTKYGRRFKAMGKRCPRGYCRLKIAQKTRPRGLLRSAGRSSGRTKVTHLPRPLESLLKRRVSVVC